MSLMDEFVAEVEEKSIKLMHINTGTIHASLDGEYPMCVRDRNKSFDDYAKIDGPLDITCKKCHKSIRSFCRSAEESIIEAKKFEDKILSQFGF